MSRLLWIHQNFVAADQPGNSRAAALLQALDRAGWSVDLVTTNETYFGDAVATDTPRGDRIRIHHIPIGSGQGRRRERSYASFAARALWLGRRLPRPDVVFATSPPLPQVLPAAAIAAWRRAPLVFEVRDLWPAFLIEGDMLRSRALIGLMRLVEAFAVRDAESLIAVSPGFVPALRAMGMTAERTTVVPTGIDPELARAPRALGESWRIRNGLDDRFLVLYAGSFNKPYGIDLLLRSAEASLHRLPRATWLFAGNGRSRDAVEAAARRLPNVRYLGSLPKPELVPVLLAADAGVNAHADWPLLDITLTGKLFDYLAAGVPVVSVRGGTMGLLLEASGGGSVIAERSPEALVAELGRWDLSPLERSAHAELVRSWARAHLDAERFASQIEQHLGATLARSPRSGAGRFLGAWAGALVSVLRGDPDRAVAPLRGPNRDALLREAFESWMRSHAVGASSRPPEAPTRSAFAAPSRAEPGVAALS